MSITARYDDATVEIYLGEKHGQMRAALRAALRDLRLEIREIFDDCESLHTALRGGNADLVIADADLSGGDVRNLIMAIRNGELGPNPFVPIIVTTWNKSPERIRELIDCGVDGLLIKPISINAIRMQVDMIINRRKPFVVTSSYIGPDRRMDATRVSDAPLIEAPNTLLAKISGNPIDPIQLRRDIADAQESVNNERLCRNAFELSFLAELIVSEDSTMDTASQIGRLARRIEMVVDDTVDRIAGTAYAHNAEICRSLSRVADTIARDHPDHLSRDTALLKPLCDAILLSLNPERNATDMAREISQSIASFRDRKAAENS